MMTCHRNTGQNLTPQDIGSKHPPWQPMDRGTISTKRRMEPDSDSSSDSPPPVAKSSKSNETSPVCNTPEYHLPQPTMPAPATPAFAPRTDYVKLIFRDNPGVELKLRWLSEVVRMFNLDRELAEVNIATPPSPPPPTAMSTSTESAAVAALRKAVAALESRCAAITACFDNIDARLYNSLVKATHDFYGQYVTRPHMQRRPVTHAWTLDNRLTQAERMVKDAGLGFQRQPTADQLPQNR
ncbi:hypothetical protein Pmani_004282 [Petrolisthes manimaculis]|uniref:Uncharacterized protein n=1 Tax=Petrolisthes manimaculis TaxID=1843537 RepID=A0AAE1UHN8_9EUCA|nr:hypothetical protein Pmani_004282 [Petrolisthes manimaculis]